MKLSLLGLTLATFLFASHSFAAALVSGQYACKSVVAWNSSDINVEGIQSALNSLGCDSSKPVSTTPVANSQGETDSVAVCCVRK